MRPCRPSHFLLSAVAGLVIFILAATPAIAQESQPTPMPIAPDECQASPIDIETFVIGGTPAPTEVIATPADTGAAEPVVVSSGATPDAATTEAAIAVVREWIACLNAQDFPRLLALGTVEYLLDWIAVVGPSVLPYLDLPGAFNPLSEPLQISLVRIDAVTVLADDRLAVEATISNPRAVGVQGGGQADMSDVTVPPDDVAPEALHVRVLLVLERTGERWLIDGEQIGDQPYLGDPIPEP